MSQEKEIAYCTANHSSDLTYNSRNYIKERSNQEFRTWSSGNVELNKIIQEYEKKYGSKLLWIPYDNFRDVKHIADGAYGSVYTAISKNDIKLRWNFNKQVWEYHSAGNKVALKEINNSRNNVSEFLKEVKNIKIFDRHFYIASCFGISKNPLSQNYIIVMELYDDSLHKFLTKNFLNLRWKTKIDLLFTIAIGLCGLHDENLEKLVHCDLHSGNILVTYSSDLYCASITDLGLCRRLADDLMIKSDNKSNVIYGSIPYIPPEVLRGNAFTREGDIYSFGGIMYEMATGKQPFYDRAHDTYLIIDICNGVRPKIPDIMLDWIPQCYSDLMYKCWAGDPSERPTTEELQGELLNLDRLHNKDNVFKIADENQEKTIKSQKQELTMPHTQSCYISRSIHTLHGLYNSLEDIKSGKSQDPNLFKSNEPTTSSVSTYDIDSKESQECIDFEKEIQNRAKKQSLSTLDCDSEKSKECISTRSCFISRSIHTLHGLHNLLEDIKSGKSQDPNLLKSNESTSSNIITYDIDSKELLECIDFEKEIQNRAKKQSLSTLDCDSEQSKECINLDKDNITFKKIKNDNL
ncbi:hypothetical protein Glove_311g16 [Diversispora epigaea]|uniref:Protein kinase domain-containing protein n=1 Tax=Diversispora epigaea TaxID=1348612 RepID=A0A397HRB4_9GLOM|nr:hypothetical protein Glove_311g16 [Diversispora epigaea]